MLHLQIAGSEFRVSAGQPVDIVASEAKATVLIRPEHVVIGDAARSLSTHFVGHIVLAGQHGGLWVSLGIMPANVKASKRDDLNSIGSYIGPMAQTFGDARTVADTSARMDEVGCNSTTH